MRSGIGSGARRWQAVAATATLAALLVGAHTAGAGRNRPEYMKIHPRVGMTVEIKGHMDASGRFLATDIEVLQGRRRPKLRTRIRRVDPEARSIEVLGRWIRITSATDFDAGGFDSLREGQWIEVKCTVKDGEWSADDVRTQSIKPRNKIKATVTGAEVDGVPPDVLDIHGLEVILEHETDVVGDRYERPKYEERRRWGRLAWQDGSVLDRGVPLHGGRQSVSVEYRHFMRNATEFDLTRQFQSDLEDMQPEVRVSHYGFWNEHLRTEATLRYRKRVVLDSELGIASPDAQFHFSRLYALVRNPGGAPVSVWMGRQDVEEPREWIYDEYLDGVRASWYGARHWEVEAAFFRAVLPFKDKFESWADVHARVMFIPKRRNRFTLWTLIRSDNDFTRRRKPRYWGLRYFGRPVSWVRAWADGAILRGEDKHRALDAWATDVGVVLRFDERRFGPSLTLAWAVGSGRTAAQKAQGIDGRFRQTGYEDNTMRLGGFANVSYYGAVLDPELSNLVVFTVGGGIRPVEDGSVELFYHRYRQHRPDNTLRGELVDPPARPNGIDDDIGWGADVVVAFPRLFDMLRVEWTAGLFDPGTAFQPRQERAFLSKINVKLVY